MASKAYAWLANQGGAWNLAANWNDLTDGTSPSTTVPGAQDSVTIAGPAGSTIETLTGSGAALSAAFSGNTQLAGAFAFGDLEIGLSSSGGLVEIGAGASLQAGGGMIASGSLLGSGMDSRIRVAGTLTLGTGQTGLGAASCNLDISNAAIAQIGGLVLDASSAALSVGPTGSLEIGLTGGAAAGAMTIDAGAQLSGQGDANAYGQTVNNGTITAAGGVLRLGATSGNGLLDIGAGATLALYGAVGAGETVVFTGSLATLAMATEFDSPAGTISGFAAGDAIDMLGSPISAATYAATGAAMGVLTLYYGGQIADTFLLAGDYSGDVFLTAGDGAGGTLITVAPDGQGGGGASGGTTTPDQYAWIRGGGGAWNLAANWADLTTGLPPKVAPGVHNLVSIAGPQDGSFAVIAGPANAASLSITGDVALAGLFSIGGLAIGDGTAQIAGALDLLPVTAITAATATIADGALSVSGAGAVLDVTGALVLGGGVSGVGLPITSLGVSAGGHVRAASLTLGGGSGNTITTDPTAIIEIGGAGGAVAGALTIDAGAVVFGNGRVNPFGLIVDNGTLQADGGILTVGSVTGTGSIAIDAGGALELESTTAVPIAFGAPGAGGGPILLLASELAAPTGLLTGFAAGDVIDIEGDPITGLAEFKTAFGIMLDAYYGNTVVARMNLAGDFTGQRFILAPDGANGTEILLVNGSSGGGGGGQGNTDLLAWAAPGSGAWSHAANWTDITTGQAASAPPGTKNAVQVTGPTGGAFQLLVGPAACNSLLFTGNTVLGGAYTVVSLTIGAAPGSALAGPGTLELGAAATMAAATATLLDGDLLLTGSGAALFVTGTLTMGGGNAGSGTATTLFSAMDHATAHLGGLAFGGGLGDTVFTDLTGAIEIGTLGGAAAGAITIDPGMAIAGNGSLNPGGLVVDNGTIAASGGTLAVGSVSGTGLLSIAGEATLELTARETCPIVFAGGGGSLLLQGSAETPAGVISGFVQGDNIITGSSPVDSVAYAPGAGGIGTLTLLYGGQVAGQLLLAGDYSGENFTVTPDGAGADITVQTNGGGGASAGTPTPDRYVWVGGNGTGWNTATNWNDLTTATYPALIAPGAHNLVTVQGGAGASFLSLVGPANAASLDLEGRVALAGQYSVGALSVGVLQSGHGLLALATGGALTCASAEILGGALLQGGTLSVSGMLSLGGQASGGVLAAAASSLVDTAALVLGGAGSAVTTDGIAVVEIGQAGHAAAGAVTVDPGATLAGAGAVNPFGLVVDGGLITASGGTLALGAVSGTGTLQIGVGATLALESSAGAGLLIDFAGAGTLSLAGNAPLAAIADFGAGDSIVLSEAGIATASYAATGAGVGVLTLADAGGHDLAQLTLLDVGVAQTFTLSATGGATVLTTQTTNPNGGGSNVGTHSGADSGYGSFVNSTTFLENQPLFIQASLEIAIEGRTSYVWTSPDGNYFGPWQPAYANLAVVTDPVANTKIIMPPAYNALLVEGYAPVLLTDGLQTGVLIVGNGGQDTIVAHTGVDPRTGRTDTLIGGAGANTTFYSDYGASIVGGGNDVFITSVGNCTISSAVGGRSIAFLGAAANLMTANGHDTIIASGGAISNDTIIATGAETVFSPGIGQLEFYAGNAPSVVVASTGTVRMVGGAGNGSTFWCGSGFSQYLGGAGTAQIFGGSGTLDVQGGSGAMTVFGGSGPNLLQGGAGPSQFVTGIGASTVSAASGNVVWLIGAANDSLIASGGNIILQGAYSTGNNIFQAGNGPTTISGGIGSDLFLAGTGAASISGGGGHDIFSFTNGLAGGSDQITNFQVGSSLISLHGYAGGTAAALASAVVSGGNTALTLGDGTHIMLLGVTNLGASSFT